MISFYVIRTDANANCIPGFYGYHGKCFECEAGYYCPGENNMRKLCPIGRYGNITGEKDEAIACSNTCGTGLLGKHKFEIKYSGTCETHIRTKEECKVAANILGFPHSNVNANLNWNSNYYPNGCFITNGDLVMSIYMNNYGTCSENRPCLCAKYLHNVKLSILILELTFFT